MTFVRESIKARFYEARTSFSISTWSLGPLLLLSVALQQSHCSGLWFWSLHDKAVTQTRGSVYSVTVWKHRSVLLFEQTELLWPTWFDVAWPNKRLKSSLEDKKVCKIHNQYQLFFCFFCAGVICNYYCSLSQFNDVMKMYDDIFKKWCGASCNSSVQLFFIKYVNTVTKLIYCRVLL